MTNQEYLSNFVGAALPLGRVNSAETNTSESEVSDFSFLLELGALQSPTQLTDEEMKRTDDNRQGTNSLVNVLRRPSLLRGRTIDWSLEEFEKDMNLLTEGLENIPVSYHGTYSREDIYLDHD